MLPVPLDAAPGRPARTTRSAAHLDALALAKCFELAASGGRSFGKWLRYVTSVGQLRQNKAVLGLLRRTDVRLGPQSAWSQFTQQRQPASGGGRCVTVIQVHERCDDDGDNER